MKVKFYLYNPLFNFHYWYCSPYWAAVMPGLLSVNWKNRCGWPWRTQAYQHPFLDFDCEKKNICMHPVWIQKSMLHPWLSCSWAMTHHIYIIDHCFLLLQTCLGYLQAALLAYKHPSMCNSQEIRVSLIRKQSVLLSLYCRHIGVISLRSFSFIFRRKNVEEIAWVFQF